MLRSRMPVVPLPAGLPPDSGCAGAVPETDRPSHRRAPRRITPVRSMDNPAPMPTSAVVCGFEAMGDPQMAEHLRGIPALEADDVILLDRTPDRNRRFPPLLGRCCAPETGERLVHLRDQCRKLFTSSDRVRVCRSNARAQQSTRRRSSWIWLPRCWHRVPINILFGRRGATSRKFPWRCFRTGLAADGGALPFTASFFGIRGDAASMS
jgi:hypothetical protein